MNWLDWVIAAVLVLSVLQAAAQGFVFELFSLTGTVLGYLMAAWGYHRAAGYLAPYVKSDVLAAGAGFLLIFVGVVIVAGVAGRIVRWAAHSVGLKAVDRLVGAAFGLLRGALVVTVLVMAMASFLPTSQALASSSFGHYFLAVGRAVVYAGPGDLKQKYHDGLKAIQGLRKAT